MEKADLVLLEQEQDAVVVLLDHRVLAADHLAKVQTQARDTNAMLGKMVAGMFKMLG